MALEITTNDLLVIPDKQVYYTGCCVIWVSNGSLLMQKKAGDMHVLHSSTHPLNGFIEAYIYIYPYILCYKYIGLLQDLI